MLTQFPPKYRPTDALRQQENVSAKNPIIFAGYASIQVECSINNSKIVGLEKTKTREDRKMITCPG